MKTTSIPWIGASRSNSTGLSASTSAAATAIHSAIHSHPSGLAEPKRARADAPEPHGCVMPNPAGAQRMIIEKSSIGAKIRL